MTRRAKAVIWVAGALVLAALVFIASVAVIIYRTIETEPSSAARAEAAMNAVRQRYGGRRPLIEVVDLRTRSVRVHRTDARERSKFGALHFLVWDPRKQTLVQGKAPAWTLRLKLSLFGSGGWSIEDFGVTAADVERYAPGILIDHRMPEGDHALVWAE